MGETALIEEHFLELHSALLAYRDRIRPRYLCLTDTASANEKTRFYAVDRAYRLVHGLVGMILQWKQKQSRHERWVVIVRNFDKAQNLATRFFVELARRATDGTIEVIVDAPPNWSNADAAKLALADSSPRHRQLEFHSGRPLPLSPTPLRCGRLQTKWLPLMISCSNDATRPLALTLSGRGREPGGGPVAVRIFIIYNSYGFYHEARHFIGVFLPHFEEFVVGDQSRRIHYVSKMNICLVMTDDPDGALWVVDEFAGAHLSRPHLVANMNYILAMHFLRYAQTKNLERAEHHILIAVEKIAQAKTDPDFHEYPFQKVFIDNGLAFLRARAREDIRRLWTCAGADMNF